MNFTSILEELNRLYEENENDIKDDELTTELNEANNSDEDTEAEAEVEAEVAETETETEIVAEEDRQLILECSKCGALCIKEEDDVAIDEETTLANKEETCSYCDEASGYKVVGVLSPYEITEAEDVEDTEEITIEDDEVIEEGIFDKFKKNKQNSDEQNPDNKPKSYADTDYVVIACYGPGRCSYVQGNPPRSDRAQAEKDLAWINRPANNVDKTTHKVVTYKDAKRWVGRPYN